MIANKPSQNDTVGRTTNQSWISLPSFILSAIDSQKQRITANSTKSVTTTNTTYQQYTSLGASVRTRISPNPFEICISSTSPLLVLSLPTKHYKFSGFTKTVWFEHENTLQNYQVKKGYAYNPERILDDIFVFTVLHNGRKYCLPFTVSSPWPQIINLK